MLWKTRCCIELVLTFKISLIVIYLLTVLLVHMQSLSFDFWQHSSSRCSAHLLTGYQTACTQWFYHLRHVLLLLFFLYYCSSSSRLYYNGALREHLLLCWQLILWSSTGCYRLTAAVWIAQIAHVFLVDLVTRLLRRYLEGGVSLTTNTLLRRAIAN